MSQNRLIAIGIVLLLALVTLASAFYTVDEREKVIVVRFGEILRHEEPPGLHFKLPFIDNALHFDARILTIDSDPQPFLTREQKYVVVDSFVKWRVADARQYYLTVGGDEIRARRRLEQIINSGLRDEFGKRTIQSVVATERSQIMEILTEYGEREARRFGIEVVDVRLQRVDLPDEVTQSVYDRMSAERARVAAELRAQGAEAAERIRADAERQREVLVAEAYREAEEVRGEGDGRATEIYAAAYGRAPAFYTLYRSLVAYRESFKDKDDILVVDPNSEFFKYMKRPSAP